MPSRFPHLRLTYRHARNLDLLIDLTSVRRLVIRNRPLHRRMGGIRNNVRREIYPKVEVDDNLGIGLGSGVIAYAPMAVIVIPVKVGVDDPGPGFFVSAVYMEVVRRWSMRVCEEEAVESFTWIAQHQYKTVNLI